MLAGGEGRWVPQKHWLLFSRPAYGNGGSNDRQKDQQAVCVIVAWSVKLAAFICRLAALSWTQPFGTATPVQLWCVQGFGCGSPATTDSSSSSSSSSGSGGGGAAWSLPILRVITAGAKWPRSYHSSFRPYAPYHSPTIPPPGSHRLSQCARCRVVIKSWYNASFS